MKSDNPGQRDELSIENIGNLITAATYVVPPGRTLIAVRSTDADVTQLRVQFLAGVTWNNIRSAEATIWDGVVNDWMFLPQKVRSDGLNYRISNPGTNDINDVLIAFESTE